MHSKSVTVHKLTVNSSESMQLSNNRSYSGTKTSFGSVSTVLCFLLYETWFCCWTEILHMLPLFVYLLRWQMNTEKYLYHVCS